MREEFLHFVWKHKLFNGRYLSTSGNKPISIINSGTHNFSSGPDFSDARINIDQTEWAGSVEIHLKSSDWLLHGHQDDEAYDNVVLHVVYEHDREIQNRFGELLPTLEMKGLIPLHYLNNYERLKQTKNSIPCSEQIEQVNRITMRSWFDRVLIERLERKAGDVSLIHQHCDGNWLETYFVLLAAYLGQNTNKLPMTELARKCSLKILGKQNEFFQRAALLLGVGGFLASPQNEEARRLNSEYLFKKEKHQLSEVTQRRKTGRVRPQNQPQRRVVQLAAMIPEIPNVLEKLFAGQSSDWHNRKLITDDFWLHHYGLNVPSEKQLSVQLSKQMATLLIINVDVPFIFYYGQMTGDQELKNRAVDMLSQVDYEGNSLVKAWKKELPWLNTAADSQSALELQTSYCNHKKCVLCNIGKAIITNL
ncbi:MAG: DUF2851 family protein [Salibacteraceae bacterium]